MNNEIGKEIDRVNIAVGFDTIKQMNTIGELQRLEDQYTEKDYTDEPQENKF